MATRKYIDLNKILSRGAYLNIICSPRGPGKSWAMKDRSLDLFFRKREKFTMVRRNEEELNSTKRTHFNDILEQKYHNKYQMKIVGSTYYIREAQPKDLAGKELTEWQALNPWEECGYAIPVSKQQQYKSSAFPDVTTIYYDEFIPSNPWSRINPDEVGQFLSLVETIVRDRKNVRIFMLSNTGFITNPYFTYYNIRSEDFLGGREFLSREGGNVAVWYYRYDESDREVVDNKISSLISRQVHRDESVEGKFGDISNAFVIPNRPDRATLWSTFTAEHGRVYRLWQYSDGFWVEEGKRIATNAAYTFSKWELAEGSIFNPMAIKKLQKAADGRHLSFASADTRAHFLKKLSSI